MITFFATNPNVGRSIATYNDNLARAELGRMQEAAAITQAQLQAKAQESALRQSYFQNQQANQLQQQQMQNEANYRNQLLENQRAQTAAQMDWQRALRESVASEADKDRQSRERIATTTAGARSNAPSQVEIDSLNNMAEAAASRYNTMLDLEKRAAEGALDEMEKKRANEWFTGSGTAKTEKGEALKKLREGGYVSQVQRVLSQLGMDKEASGLLQFDGQKFVPKMLRLPGSAGTSATAAPAAGGNSTDALIREAQDAITRGANPAAVQERLQRDFGLVLPGMGSGFFGGTTSQTNVWPPVASAPVAPARPSPVMPIPGATNAPPAAAFFGEQFPQQFSDLGRGYFR